MPTLIVVGALWGDEAKGKLVDVLAENADYTIRFSGGNNAGHTVRIGEKTFRFHLLPTGFLRPNCTAVLGGGMVVCPKSFVEEIEEISGLADEVGRLIVSGSAHVVMPWHRAFDCLEEERRARQIGTTQRGIGPAYEDKAGRRGIRVYDFVDPERFRQRVEEILPIKNAVLEAFGSEPILAEAVLEEYLPYAEKMAPYVGNVESEIRDALRQGKRLLFEGAQGALLDLDYGTYPFVTSSHPSTAGACIGTGLTPADVQNVLGVCVAYATRVGAGPFPTELSGEIADHIRTVGKEFGTTTGRPRRVGWQDLVALRYSAQVNGFTSLALTRADVLNGLDEVKVCVGYSIEGQTVEQFPTDTELLAKAEPIYETLPGWEGDLSTLKRFDDLPKELRQFVLRMEEFVGVPVSILSTGPKRHEVLIREPSLLWP
ncbi:MAG: adenylosuccinate synthetase [Fimbriimonadales bacterium]|nr:MAG: adenylosuccinate synthetase [Fimbriimonadales bacterium]